MAGALFPTRWKSDKPPSIEEFVGTLHDDYACADYLFRKRWPGGFVCPHCGSTKAWRLETRPWLWECAGKGQDPTCRKQTSVIAGTVMQGTHLPLRKWFLAAYLMATHSNSISALQIQPKIGVSYKTAWLLLHKLRRAMVDPDRTPLSGDVDVDESSIPYRRQEDALERGGGSSKANQIWIAGAVERIGRFGVGRIRLACIEDRSAQHLVPFVVANTLPGTMLRTDSHSAYRQVPDRHLEKVNLSKSMLPAHVTFKWIHVVFANLKRWGMGTFHGFREKHLDAYLNEFVFRWNRRRSFETAMNTMLGIGQRVGPLTYRDIVGDTSDWREDHREEILAMVDPQRLKLARAIAKGSGGISSMSSTNCGSLGSASFTRDGSLAARRCRRGAPERNDARRGTAIRPAFLQTRCGWATCGTSRPARRSLWPDFGANLYNRYQNRLRPTTVTQYGDFERLIE